MENKIKSKYYGTCRFCLSEGNHKDIMKEYKYNGIREVYYDIFQECFNICLSTSSERSSLICISCVVKLQAANSFRTMVVTSEQQLLDVLDDKQTVFVNVGKELAAERESLQNTDVKSEYNDGTNECSHGSECDDVSPISDLKNEEVEGERELLSRFTRLKPLPTRKTLYKRCKEFVKHLDQLKGKIITARSLQKLQNINHNGKIYITNKIAHIANIKTLLESSNMTAFKSKRRSVQCFYCRKIFEDPDELRQHQIKCKGDIKKILSKIPSESLVVYVDVNNLSCTICGGRIQNINELKNHLLRVHKKKMYPDYGDRIIPFKILKSGYECHICGFNFETFGAIERHMNVHYRNYVCDKCGAGYITKNRLKIHIKHSHANGSFPCDICNKVFTSSNKFRSHVDSVHRMVKRNKCPKCPERFSDYFNRHKHMVDVHGDPPLRYKCNVCDMLFRRRYALSCHMKRRHLEVRDVKCGLCSYKCYTRTELKVHMIKHSGERTYECVVCKKSYARKKTLKEHLRIHNNDKRYVCSVCGQGFIQNCSLKGHMKAHHFVD